MVSVFGVSVLTLAYKENRKTKKPLLCLRYDRTCIKRRRVRSGNADSVTGFQYYYTNIQEYSYIILLLFSLRYYYIYILLSNHLYYYSNILLSILFYTIIISLLLFYQNTIIIIYLLLYFFTIMH